MNIWGAVGIAVVTVFVLVLVLVLVLLLLYPANNVVQGWRPQTQPDASSSPSTVGCRLECETGLSKKGQLVKLWSDQVYWTRMFVISRVFNLPTNPTDTERLLQNQKRIGELLGSPQLSDLLTQHVVLESRLLDAAIKGDKQAYAAIREQWEVNMQQIYRATPHNDCSNCPECESSYSVHSPSTSQGECDCMQQLLLKHLDLLEREIQALVKGEYEASVRYADESIAVAIRIAKLVKLT